MMTRPSQAVRIAEKVGSTVSRIFVGLIALAGGVVLCVFGFGHEQHILGYVGIGVGFFGANMLPGVFDAAKPIYIMIFPNGIPLIGGRRSNDPPPPAQP